MKQHTPSYLFPAAAVMVIVSWIVSITTSVTVPAEVSAAGTALLGYIALRFGLSKDGSSEAGN